MTTTDKTANFLGAPSEVPKSDNVYYGADKSAAAPVRIAEPFAGERCGFKTTQRCRVEGCPRAALGCNNGRDPGKVCNALRHPCAGERTTAAPVPCTPTVTGWALVSWGGGLWYLRCPACNALDADGEPYPFVVQVPPEQLEDGVVCLARTCTATVGGGR